ncbi:MAG: BlaI/MecI/CopY family transcriptional regulator [Sphingobacteriales bacterium]|nr:MAG: BlaI/MecI/CopY family transcriptional regulator [Sphingobacteriales bacterium]
MKANFKTLTKAEEEIMQVLWKLDKAFVKDIVDELPDIKPHYNTVSTIIKILEEKGFVDHESFGKSNRYYPLVKKEDYTKKSMKQFVSKYFDGSFANMLSFFAKEKDISIQELESLLNEIKKSSPKK